MQRKIGRALAVLAAGGAVSQVTAVEPSDLLLFQKGPVLLKPQLTLTTTFNDNITYRDEDQQADLVSVISPGLALQVGRRDFNYLDLSYMYERVLYLDNSELDANQHHFASGLKWENNRLTLTGSDSIDFLSSPIGGGYNIDEADGGEGISGLRGFQIDRTRYFDLYRLTWGASERTDLYLQIMHVNLDYDDGLPLYDSRTLTGTLGFEYQPFVKTSFFGETYFGQTENERNLVTQLEYPSANFIGSFVGVRGQFSQRLRGTVKAGFEHRFYSDDGPSLNAPVVELGLTYHFSDHTVFSANYSRRQNESIQFRRAPYVTDAVSASWSQVIGGDGRLRSAMQATYLISTFDDDQQVAGGRVDEVIAASLTISYDVKLWMRAFGSYNFEHLDSNLPSIVDYNVNRVLLGLKIGY